MNRNDVTELIIAAKIKKGLKWEDVARRSACPRNGSPPAASAR
jgi:cyanate lyase